MKIIVITQDEPFFTQITLKKLVQARGDEIKAIFFLPHYLIFGSSFSMFRYYLSAYGIGFIFRIAWRRSIKFITKLAAYVLLIKRQGLDYYINKFSIPVYNIKKINNQVMDKIQQISPDLIISLSATQVFSDKLLNLPGEGCINLHSGPLPYYRGLFPTFWQLFNEEKEIGLTVHFMDKNIDGGKILLQGKVQVSPDDSLFSLLDRVKHKGAQILLEALRLIETKNITAIPNDITKGSYYVLPKREDIKKFLYKGKKLF